MLIESRFSQRDSASETANPLFQSLIYFFKLKLFDRKRFLCQLPFLHLLFKQDRIFTKLFLRLLTFGNISDNSHQRRASLINGYAGIYLNGDVMSILRDYSCLINRGDILAGHPFQVPSR